MSRKKTGKYSVGARCPRCGGTLRVLWTRSRTGQSILRYRVCPNCRWHAKTVEHIPQDDNRGNKTGV